MGSYKSYTRVTVVTVLVRIRAGRGGREVAYSSVLGAL